ncbi:Acetylcholine receptor subunit beta-like 1 [Pseudolycoriella hygida]|uniref:Acetylcholine receptor subunit beta-like 1 n=1 Tax=Pseudolycoriella hygida TaxID=35572 RepID=A0A9Q0N366_9DIPT|nr:Acetylcholine receptor subunit beta-like 1 [Pseudolycoriella hygida]
MILKCEYFYIFVTIISTSVIGNDRLNELYSKILTNHNYLVPPSSSNISVSVNLELGNLQKIDTRNQEMTFTAIMNLKWNDSSLLWNRKEFPHVNRVAVSSERIWTPDILIFNSNSKDIQNSRGDLFISADGQVHWPIFGHFKTSCTIDVTYYPFDQQVCIIKIGSVDRTVQVDYSEDSINLDQFYFSVYWDVINCPAYRNVYKTHDDEYPVETDVTYYLIIKRRTSWLSEVYPSLAFSLISIIPAIVTRPLEKLILLVFCIAGLFALHIDTMNKLPHTSLATSLASKYIVTLILCNLIHLTIITIIDYRRGCFQWIAKQIPFKRMRKSISRGTERYNCKDENRDKEDMEKEENQSEVHADIFPIINWIILALLIIAVAFSTLYFLLVRPH